jgi:hypothetical protein
MLGNWDKSDLRWRPGSALSPWLTVVLCILCGKSCIPRRAAFLCSVGCVFSKMFLGADCTQYTTLCCLQDDPSLKWHWGDPARPNILKDQSRWPRGLRRGSAAAGLLGFRVHIPPESWMSVWCEWSVLIGRGLCVGLITCPEVFYRVWCVWVWAWSRDIEVALPTWGSCAIKYRRKGPLEILTQIYSIL